MSQILTFTQEQIPSKISSTQLQEEINISYPLVTVEYFPGSTEIDGESTVINESWLKLYNVNDDLNNEDFQVYLDNHIPSLKSKSIISMCFMDKNNSSVEIKTQQSYSVVCTFRFPGTNNIGIPQLATIIAHKHSSAENVQCRLFCSNKKQSIAQLTINNEEPKCLKLTLENEFPKEACVLELQLKADNKNKKVYFSNLTIEI